MAAAQSGNSNNQYVVVWEWYNECFGWQPYSPYVSQSLERAHSKKLKKLYLGDTEPSLSNYFVLFDRMEQICSKSDKAHQVRRTFYPQSSPAGSGRVWEWYDKAGWKSYNMEVQYVIDDAYHNTDSSQLDLSKCFPQLPYIIDLEKDKQIRKESKYERKIRCANIASYPMTKPTDQDIIITLADIKSSKTKRFMGKITSLVKSISVPNSPKKGNLAQSSQTLPGPRDLSQVPGPSGRRVRRPSSDTVSTYLSKDSSGVDSNENLVDLDTSKDEKMSTRSAPNKQLRVPDTKNDILRSSSYVVEQPDGDCAICYCPLAEKGGYSRLKDCPIELSQCGHVFHLCCLEQMAHDQINQTGIRCPSCKELYGVYTGNMPHGSMKHYVRSYSLPGYEGYNTIEIVYNFRAGTQGPEHPNPGRPYYATGFPRTAYLPDSPEGKTALKLLQTAFERRLTFTVGRSTTTGRDDVITWNEIHHKTSKDNRNGHGYPDSNYLTNLLQELASFGIM